MIKQLLKNRLPKAVLLLLIITVMAPIRTFAETFTIDELTYTTLYSNEVSVKASSESISGDVVIPASISYNGVNYKVTSIEQDAFNGCSALTSITIPESVTSIGICAFYGCSALTSITIPEGVTSIYDSAFNGCSALTSISIPEGVTSIGGIAFYGCSALTSITIPEGVTSIDDYAFGQCKSLISINVDENNQYFSSCEGVLFDKAGRTLLVFPAGKNLNSYIIPNSVTSIGNYAFSDCSSLTTITIPESVTSIGYSAFQYCFSLTSITIPEGVTSIGIDTFLYCSALTSITIPEGVTSIGVRAFSCCSSLISINVNENNQYFSSCEGVLFDKAGRTLLVFPAGKNLNSYIIPNSVTSIGNYAFEHCSALTSVYIPESVTSIGYSAFQQCYSLTSITIPEGVTSIGINTFWYCSSLTSITIPKSVTSIGYSAFNGCSSLSEVTCLAMTPPILGSYAFASNSKTLYVPKVAIDAYTNSDWKHYFSSIEAMPEIGLTINYEGNGKVYHNSIAVENGTKYEGGTVTLFILADDGNQIVSATLKDVDVKDQIINHILTVEDCDNADTLKVVFAPVVENEASLTVKGHESHSVTHFYKEGTRAKVNITPESGWSLYSLSLNGENVTEEVVDSKYTTPALVGDNHLEVVMKSDSNTNVDQIEVARRKLSFRKYGNTVEILNLEDGETIAIYNDAGACEYQGKNHTVTLNTNNVYILRTEKETLKFAL